MFHNSHQGFTLIEVLLYVGIFAIVAGLMVGILTTVVQIGNRESNSANVVNELNFSLQTIQRLVRSASNIEIPTGVATSTLILRMSDPSGSYEGRTIIALEGGAITIKYGSNPSSTITSNKVIVNSLIFKKYSQYPGHDSVSVDLTMSSNATNPQGQLTRTLSSAIARVSAATFDDNLLPGANTFTVGINGTPWHQVIVGNSVPNQPGYTFDTNNTTGIYSPGPSTNILGFSTNGLERMRIDQNGNVGIGTTTPSFPLDIVNPNNPNNNPASLLHLLNAKATGLGLQITQQNGVGKVQIQNNAGTGASITLDQNDSNMGINTANPGYALDVNGTINTSGFVMPTGASNGYVLTSDASGNGTWKPATGGGGASNIVLFPDASTPCVASIAACGTSLSNGSWTTITIPQLTGVNAQIAIFNARCIAASSLAYAYAYFRPTGSSATANLYSNGSPVTMGCGTAPTSGYSTAGNNNDSGTVLVQMNGGNQVDIGASGAYAPYFGVAVYLVGYITSGGGGGASNFVVYKTPGTYTFNPSNPPTPGAVDPASGGCGGCNAVMVEVWGGGEGGAGDNGLSGGDSGGAAGGYGKNTFAVTNSNYTVTVGSGGIAGTATGNPAGPGGTSSFTGSVSISATGGSGTYGDVPGASSAPINITGEGSWGGSQGGAAGNGGFGGHGGTGGIGANPGGGGGGALPNLHGNGNNGAPGQVIIWW